MYQYKMGSLCDKSTLGVSRLGRLRRLSLVFWGVVCSVWQTISGITTRDVLAVCRVRAISNCDGCIWIRYCGCRLTACGRANEIDLACAVFVPQINVEYKHGMVNITEIEWVRMSLNSSTYPTALGCTYLQSISFPVARSVMTSRTQGGGVIGRRSYRAVSSLLEVVARDARTKATELTLSPKPHIRARRGCWTTSRLGS